MEARTIHDLQALTRRLQGQYDILQCMLADVRSSLYDARRALADVEDEAEQDERYLSQCDEMRDLAAATFAAALIDYTDC